MDDFRSVLGLEAFVGLLAVAVHAIVRILRAGKVNDLLAKFGRKPIPNTWIPWLALGLGGVAGALDAYLAGAARAVIIRTAVEGLIAGGLAIAGYELGPGTLKRIKAARPVAIPEAPEAPADDEPKKPDDEPKKPDDEPKKPDDEPKKPDDGSGSAAAVVPTAMLL